MKADPKNITLSELKNNRDWLQEKMINAMLEDRPYVGKQSWRILKNALSLTGNSNLYGRTLLDKKIRLDHKERMIKRFDKLVSSMVKNGWARQQKRRLI